MDDGNWTPYEIKILLHAHAVRTDWQSKDAPIYRDTVTEFTRLGLVTELPDGLITTPRGDALCSMWMKTPLPEQVWIDPRSGKPI
jgi:hypothetical protein